MSIPFASSRDINRSNGITSLNASTTPLSNGATFTGPGEQNFYDHVGVFCITDQGGTLDFQFSNDGSNWYTFPTNGFPITANIPKFQTAVKLGRYFRVVLENTSGSDQTSLDLRTYYGDNFVPASSPLNQTVGIDQQAIFVRSTVAQDEIRISRRGGVRGFTKFGYRTGLTAAGGDETIWATTGNFTPLDTASTYTITYNNTLDGSTSTGARTLFFDHVDENGLPETVVHTLGSSGSDVTSFTGLGINRVAVSSSSTNEANGADITITETTGGTTQAIIPAGQSVTQQAIFHVGANHDAIAKYLWINALKLTGGGGSPRVTVKGFVRNRAVATQFEIFRADIDTGVNNLLVITEPIGFNLSPSDVLWFTADTDTNNAAVNLRFSLNEYQRT